MTRFSPIPKLVGLIAFFLAGVSTDSWGHREIFGDEANTPRFVSQWGTEGSGNGEFSFPIGIAIHQNTLFVTDHYNSRVQKFDTDGKFLGILEVLRNPGGIGIDKNGRLFISHFPAMRTSDSKNPDRVSVYNSDGTFVREWGRSGTGDGEMDYPGGVSVGPDNRIYVADQTNRRVQIFDDEGKFLGKFGEYGLQPGQFGGNSNPKARVGGPNFLAFDKQGFLYTTEASVGRIQKLTREGSPVLAWGNLNDEPGGFGGAFTGFKDKKTFMQGPIGVFVDAHDRIWVTSINGRIQQFDSDGKLIGGLHGGQGSEPGQFYAPHGIVGDSQGNLYVVDSYNHRIQKFATGPTDR